MWPAPSSKRGAGDCNGVVERSHHQRLQCGPTRVAGIGSGPEVSSSTSVSFNVAWRESPGSGGLADRRSDARRRFNEARRDSPGSGATPCAPMGMHNGFNVAPGRGSPGSAATVPPSPNYRNVCFNVARRDSPGSASPRPSQSVCTEPASMRPGAIRRDQGPLRSVLWRRQMRYRLRALYPDALNAACRRPLSLLHHWTARTPNGWGWLSVPAYSTAPNERRSTKPAHNRRSRRRQAWLALGMPLWRRGRGRRDGVATIVAIHGITRLWAPTPARCVRSWRR